MFPRHALPKIPRRTPLGRLARAVSPDHASSWPPGEIAALIASQDPMEPLRQHPLRGLRTHPRKVGLEHRFGVPAGSAPVRAQQLTDAG